MAIEEVTPKRSARDQHQVVQGRLRSANATMSVLMARPGLPPELSDASESLRVRIADLTARTAETWKQLSQPTPQAARQAADQLRARANQLKTQKDAAENQLAHARANMNPITQQQMPGFAVNVTNFTEQFTKADAEASAAEALALRLPAEQEKAQSSPNDVLDSIARELESVQREANALYEEAAGRDKAIVAWQGIAPDRTELKDGVTFHRKEASFHRWAMLGLAVIIAAILVETAVNFDVQAGLIRFALYIGVRAASLGLVAGLIVFLGKLHSRHARQAVIYQEKLVGLDVVQMVVQNANAETARSIIDRLARTYLRAPADAFRDAHQDADGSLGGALKLVEKAASLQGKLLPRRKGDKYS